MCIRDRLRLDVEGRDERGTSDWLLTEEAAARCAAGRVGADGADLEARGAREVGVVAVSYTHLRAHETVLDLVFRLLLEKKKTHNNNYTLRHNTTQHNHNNATSHRKKHALQP